VDGSVVFARLRQCALHLTHASLGHPRPYPKRHLDRFSRFCTSHGRESLYFTLGRSFPLKIAPSHGESGPHVIVVSWAHLSPHPKRHLDRSSRFCGVHDRDSQSDRPTDRPRYPDCNNRHHLRRTATRPKTYKNSPGDEIANVNFYAVRPEATRIR